MTSVEDMCVLVIVEEPVNSTAHLDVMIFVVMLALTIAAINVQLLVLVVV